MFHYRRGAPGAQLTDPRAIAALASPVRQDLFDTIEALGGTASVAELAGQLGRPADGLYYHLEALRRAGLLAIAQVGRSRAGRRERRYRIPVRGRAPVSLGYQPRNAAAVRGVVGGMLRIARRDFDRALAGGAAVNGPGRELWAARRSGWVSDAELAAINRTLAALVARLRRPRDPARRRLISLCFVLAPLDARPPRRGDPDRGGRARRAPSATVAAGVVPVPQRDHHARRGAARSRAGQPERAQRGRPGARRRRR